MSQTITASFTAPSIPNRRLWAGRIASALPALFLAFDGAIKLARTPQVAECCARMEIPIHLIRGLGLLELALVALYLVRRTAVLGAVLLTGFLGGAVALHLRLGDPLPSHTLFPIYVGALCWVGLYLRDARVRALVS